MMPTEYNLSTAFATVAAAIPDHTFITWRNNQLTYRDTDNRIDGIAHFLARAGLGCHTERHALEGHESGQDHLGVYLRNGNEYLESTVAGYRARLAPFNVNYRYVENELFYLLNDSRARALVYGAEFAPRLAAVRDRLPNLSVLIQVADESGNPLLPGAVDFESITSTPPPDTGMPVPQPDDLYLLYTGGTTGMPKGVLWRQHDIFVSAMGGRPFGSTTPLESYEALANQAKLSAGATSLLMLPPLMHGAAQWAAFYTVTIGGRLVFPDDVEKLLPDAVLRLAEREKVLSIPVVGDAMARPLADALETGNYDLSSLMTINNGGAALSPTVRQRLLSALPHLTVMDAVGSSETGAQMSTVATAESGQRPAVFAPQPDTTVITTDFGRVAQPGGEDGWLARRDFVPLGYLGDAKKTARTFPVIDGVRWSVPGDRARLLADGQVELLGRDSVTINTGGEKVFAEEVERALAAHPAVYDVVVVGRPSDKWGSEVVAVVQLATGQSVSDDDLVDVCGSQLARYKIPKAFVRVPEVVRSPAGKADYRWAKGIAGGSRVS